MFDAIRLFFADAAAIDVHYFFFAMLMTLRA